MKVNNQNVNISSISIPTENTEIPPVSDKPKKNIVMPPIAEESANITNNE